MAGHVFNWTPPLQGGSGLRLTLRHGLCPPTASFPDQASTFGNFQTLRIHFCLQPYQFLSLESNASKEADTWHQALCSTSGRPCLSASSLWVS